MKHCAKCEADLPTSLDEYGPIQAPVCQACWFVELTEISPANVLKIKELESELNDVEDEISDLESDRRELETQIRSLRNDNGVSWCKQQKQLKDWEAGKPKTVPAEPMKEWAVYA